MGGCFRGREKFNPFKCERSPLIPLTDEDYERFEEQIPALAERATHEACERASQSGFAVTVLRGDSIVQVVANGDVKELKKTG